ncbi:cell division protein FtsH [Candidatus Uhrbacteria bacterium RIFCSPHIGHO2_12_FULL_54_23]|uniref:ATP-dependent zinc metalloprotease FtsH n=3 Tax=Candidatus Uhriibacteriota TaxID=1752732 RepID=A0A1F7UFJ7_9BACT|nr:MAG: ATP-dependent zinc metalloprotease FtsH [Parcubacteria group bacterium GW2011_GWA2_53_21]OGL77036.1 MAG: cell division protein FtsH [Candidatus Uhrbacteria bacterium RIFCSPHIGHO2_12_FULL_54_23]OGL85575.1 MAG: cell division protein FtsH [Candidatus Uhrbacteria bacterium RIFCSPLOWO2_01_FULL_55_36]OGL89579.1 MAG: cell division protein FtsH [Candidatus Uhrbacteria bacterium RIFCSPLOWO2_02_FULL_54_37]
MRQLVRNFLILLGVFLLVAALLSSVTSPFTKTTTVGIGEVVQYIEKGEVTHIRVEGDTLVVTLKSEETVNAKKEPTESFTELMQNYGVTPETLRALPVEVKDQGGALAWLSAIVPFLIPFLLISLFIWFMMRQVQGANQRALSFGESRAREMKAGEKKEQITFKDVAGAREAKQELQEVVEFLRTPKKFTELGAKIPKGVLLVGAPGVGKTLLARAIAGEASVPFFHISGSEFVEMFVGVGASRVRDLFRKAKKSAPCILFVDELDAVGRQRGAGLGGSHDEREQTLNQILVEMDGFEPNAGVVVVAATNRPDVLDSALLRPGRFDRRVMIDLPDIRDRQEILQIHAKGKPLAPDVDLKKVATRTPGFSGADLANLLNEAAILSARRNKKKVGLQEIFESTEKVMLGPERKSHMLSDDEKRITAYHEAGHALVAHTLPHSDHVHKVSIISRGSAGGYTLKLPDEDRHLRSYSQFIAELAVLLAGFVVEKEVFGEVTTGATSDLKRATKLARQLVMEYGMSEALGPRTFGEHEELIFLGREITEQRDYSEKIAEQIDKEVSRFITQAAEQACAIVKKGKEKIDAIVQALLKDETLEREAFEAIVGPRPATVKVKV